MKTIRPPRFLCLKTLLISGALTVLTGWSVSGFADDSKSGDLRFKAEQLLREAADLKADGAVEESARLAREAGELQRSAKRIQKEQRENRERGDGADREAVEKSLHYKVLLAAGKMDAAVKVRQDLEQLMKARDQARSAELAEAKEHLKEIRQEIEQLRQKGRHEEALRLEERAMRMKEKIVAAEHRPGPIKAGPRFQGSDRARMQDHRPGQPPAVSLPQVHENAIPDTGTVVEYWPDGRRKSERLYRDGKIVTAVYYASNGTRVYEMSEEPKGK